MVTAEFLRSLAADVAAGRPVELSFDDFPCFTAKALEGRAHVTPAALAEISAGLTPADACVFERAAKAIDEGDLAWIDKETVLGLPTWEGDAIFLKLLVEDEKRFFSLRLVYEGDTLVEHQLYFY